VFVAVPRADDSSLRAGRLPVAVCLLAATIRNRARYCGPSARPPNEPTDPATSQTVMGLPASTEPFQPGYHLFIMSAIRARVVFSRPEPSLPFLAISRRFSAECASEPIWARSESPHSLDGMKAPISCEDLCSPGCLELQQPRFDRSNVLRSFGKQSQGPVKCHPGQ